MSYNRDLASIHLDLESQDEEVRRLAVERLSILDESQAAQLLIPCLGDPSWRVRKAAVERVCALPNPWEHASEYIEALADGENTGRRNAALEVLVHCGSHVVPELIAATQDSDADVRKQVVDALAGIADHQAITRLLELLSDSDPNVRAAAADALGGIDDSRCGPALMQIVNREDENRLVQFAALRSLSRLEWHVTARELAGALDDSVLRPAALSVLGAHPEDENIEALLKGLSSNSRATREAAMDALMRLLGQLDGVRAGWLIERIGQSASECGALIEDAVSRLETADLSTRLVLVQFLGLLRHDSVVMPLLQAGRDEALADVVAATLAALGPATEQVLENSWDELEHGSRPLACYVLGFTRGEAGERRLLAALEDVEPGLRVAAARALGRRRCVNALPALVRRLESTAGCDDPGIEDELRVMGDMLTAIAGPEAGCEPATTDRAIELLVARLDGAPDPVRLAFAGVIGRVGRSQNTDVVSLLLKDPSAPVRRAAVHALARIEDGSTSEPLRLALADESPFVRIAAAQALGASSQSGVIEDLKRLADDEDPHVRAAATRAIGHRAAAENDATVKQEAHRLLVAALTDEGVVAMAALDSFREVGGSESAAACMPMLGAEDPEMVLGAVSCIGRHGDASQLEKLVPLVCHDHWSVRAEAIETLAERHVTQAVPAVLRRLEVEQDEFVRDAMLRALKQIEG